MIKVGDEVRLPKIKLTNGETAAEGWYEVIATGESITSFHRQKVLMIKSDNAGDNIEYFTDGTYIGYSFKDSDITKLPCRVFLILDHEALECRETSRGFEFL